MFGGPVSAIKTLIDMLRGKSVFDAVDAILATLEVARAAITVLVPQRSPFGPLSIDSGPATEAKTCEGEIKVDPKDLKLAEAPDTVDNEATEKFLVAGLNSLLPPEARDEPTGEFEAKMIFPVEIVAQTLLLWTLNKAYGYIVEKLQAIKKDSETPTPKE